MNVKPGDIARIVDSRTPNDGAVVFVERADPQTAAECGLHWWIVRGNRLAGYLDTPWPTSVTDEVTVPDQCLRRIDPGENTRDGRELLGHVAPIPVENACLTT